MAIKLELWQEAIAKYRACSLPDTPCQSSVEAPLSKELRELAYKAGAALLSYTDHPEWATAKELLEASGQRIRVSDDRQRALGPGSSRYVLTSDGLFIESGNQLSKPGIVGVEVGLYVLRHCLNDLTKAHDFIRAELTKIALAAP